MLCRTAFALFNPRHANRPPNRHAACHALALSAYTLALLSACGGGGGAWKARRPPQDPPPRPPSATQRGETVVDKGSFWERGAGHHISLSVTPPRRVGL